MRFKLLFILFLVGAMHAVAAGRRTKVDSLLPQAQSVLVMQGHLPGMTTPCQSLTLAQQMASAVAAYYVTTSHGGIPTFDQQVVPDIEIPPPADGQCHFDEWADYLDAQAKANYGADPAAYKHTMYLIPNANCFSDSGGFSPIAAKRSWVFICGAQTMGHELGHSLGMDHATSRGLEYGDGNDIMTYSGSPIREVNALHRLQMNWIPDARVVDVAISGNYVVGALERDDLSIPQILRIRRSNAVDDYIYLSYREPIGPYDSGLPLATFVYRWGNVSKTDLKDVIADADVYEESGIARVQQISHGGGQASLRIDLGVIANPDFTIAASPSTVSAPQGGSTTSVISTTPSNGFNSAVTLTASGQPAGVGVSFSPNPASESSTATFTVSAGTAPGTYPITVTGTGGGVTHSTSVTLTVSANTPPIASFTFNCTGLGCTFDGSGTTDDHGVVSYQWTFKNAAGTVLGQQTTATPTTSFTFPADGNDYATLTASDGALTSTTSRALTVTSAPAAAPLSFFALPPCRAFDSRSGSPLARGTVRNITIAGTVGVDDPGCGVPKSAAAVAVTATAISPDGDGWMNLYSDGHR
jgi:gametolysin peptidase M11